MKKLAKNAAFILLAGVAMTAFGKPIDRMIEKLDNNEDGMISAEEFQPPRNRGMMKYMDMNKDGVVTMDEINEQFGDDQAKIALRKAATMARAKDFFSVADIDGDGFVTEEEAQSAAFNRIDKNSDGYLTKGELRNAKPNQGGRHRGGRLFERFGS